MENKSNYEEFDVDFSQEMEAEFFSVSKEKTWNQIQHTQHKTKKIMFRPLIGAKYAAVLAIGVGIGYWTFNQKEIIIVKEETPIVMSTTVPDATKQQDEIKPNQVTRKQLLQNVIAQSTKGNPSNTQYPKQNSNEIITAQEQSDKAPQEAILSHNNVSARQTSPSKVVTLADILPQQTATKSSKLEKRIAKTLHRENSQYANTINIKSVIKSF